MPWLSASLYMPCIHPYFRFLDNTLGYVHFIQRNYNNNFRKLFLAQYAQQHCILKHIEYNSAPMLIFNTHFLSDKWCRWKCIKCVERKLHSFNLFSLLTYIHISIVRSFIHNFFILIFVQCESTHIPKCPLSLLSFLLLEMNQFVAEYILPSCFTNSKHNATCLTCRRQFCICGRVGHVDGKLCCRSGVKVYWIWTTTK